MLSAWGVPVSLASVLPHHPLNQHSFANKISGDDSKVVVWSIASGEKLFVAERPFNGAATAISWASRDTSRFVVGFASGDLHFFQSEDGKVMKIICFTLI